MNLKTKPPHLIEKVRGLIFDLDGTLYDSKNIALRLVFSSLPDIGLIRAERVVRKKFKGCDYGSAEVYYREFFAAIANISGRSPDFLRAWYFEKYMPLMRRTLKIFYTARPGAAELFETLGNVNTGQGRPFAVYSDYPLVRERLEAIGLAGTAAKLYSPEDFGAQKPAARPFLAIAEEMGCTPGEVLVVGDREDTDGEGAAAAGMGFIKITDGLLRRLIQSGEPQ
jgi:FMN phosphatase YigB (HAD superfamily)